MRFGLVGFTCTFFATQSLGQHIADSSSSAILRVFVSISLHPIESALRKIWASRHTSIWQRGQWFDHVICLVSLVLGSLPREELDQFSLIKSFFLNFSSIYCRWLKHLNSTFWLSTKKTNFHMNVMCVTRYNWLLIHIKRANYYWSYCLDCCCSEIFLREWACCTLAYARRRSQYQTPPMRALPTSNKLTWNF